MLVEPPRESTRDPTQQHCEGDMAGEDTVKPPTKKYRTVKNNHKSIITVRHKTIVNPPSPTHLQ